MKGSNSRSKLRKLKPSLTSLKTLEAGRLAYKDVVEARKNALKSQCEKLQSDIDNINNSKDAEISEANDKLKKEMFEVIQKKKLELFSLQDDQFEGKIKLIVQQNHFLVNELEYQTRQTENLEFKNNKLRINLQSLKNEIEIHKNMESELGKRAIYLKKLQADFVQKNSLYRQKLDNLDEKRNQLIEKRNNMINLKKNQNSFKALKLERGQQLEIQSSVKAELAARISHVDEEIAKMRRDYIQQYNIVVLVHYMLKQFKEKILQQAVYSNKLADTKKLVKFLKKSDDNFIQKKAFVHMGKFQNDFKQAM